MITRKVGAYTVLMDDDSPLIRAKMIMKLHPATGQLLPYTLADCGYRYRKIAARLVFPQAHNGPIIYRNGDHLDLRRANLCQPPMKRASQAQGKTPAIDAAKIEVVEQPDGTRIIRYKGKRIGSFRVTRKGFYESKFTGTPRYYSSPDQVIREAMTAHLRKPARKHRATRERTTNPDAKPQTCRVHMDTPGAATARALLEACGHTVLAAESA